MKLAKRISIALLAACVIGGSAFAMTACGDDSDPNPLDPQQAVARDIKLTMEFLVLDQSITHEQAYSSMKEYRDTLYELEGPESERYQILCDICDAYEAQDIPRVYGSMIEYVEWGEEGSVEMLIEYPEDGNLTYSRQIEFHRSLLDAYEDALYE